MTLGSISKIETMGLVDGPGIRTVIFLNGCKLRCKFCHNPETWKMKKGDVTPEELATKILRNKNYFGKNGGVTFSGGEPLLQSEFIIEVAKILKKENIHIALDTAGVGNGNYEELLSYIDLILFDIKQITEDAYKELTGYSINDSLEFIKVCNKLNKKIWIRQVIVPGKNDNDDYINELVKVVKTINNVEEIEFLPYHKMGSTKYDELGIVDPYKDIPAMDKIECDKLYNKFMSIYEKEK